MRKSRVKAFTLPRKTEPKPHTRHCDIPGCAEAGEFRAPRSRERLNQHYWFCLEHVRQYNAAWDYCAGMSIQEIEAHIRADQTWRRPSWPLGTKKDGAQANGKVRFDLFDGFGLLDEFEIPGANRANGNGKGGKEWKSARPGASVGEAVRHALALLDLEPPVTFAVIKSRYKALVKRQHPDANGGDKGAEERLKVINEAYTVLKGFYLPQVSPAG